MISDILDKESDDTYKGNNKYIFISRLLDIIGLLSVILISDIAYKNTYTTNNPLLPTYTSFYVDALNEPLSHQLKTVITLLSALTIAQIFSLFNKHKTKSFFLIASYLAAAVFFLMG